MKELNHAEIEKKWQQYWEENNINRTGDSDKEKFYILDMFPYPSGDGLHVGHPKGYIATDVYSRMKKMRGFDVLHPMGFDAFGLPAEQFALKNKENPNISTARNVARYKEQLKMLGLNYDWEREINTTDPKFYKWTQWMWKQMYKQGLAYESFDPINWCPSCKTGLANEDLDGNTCERCGSIIEKKKLRQWTIRITDYAERLLTDLDNLNWEPHIKELQRNWIGKSEGAEVVFDMVNDSDNTHEPFTIFTTRPDTLYGCTYTVLAPEHALVESLLQRGVLTNAEDIRAYIHDVQSKSDIERGAEGREKTGVRLEGVHARNPINNALVPVYIADYVLASYGTGAIMAVPAHDERDHEFAQKFGIDIVEVIEAPENFDGTLYTGTAGISINSGDASGLSYEDVREHIIRKLESENRGKKKISYKLRDWVFARQRYWGEPFPIVFDENHNSFAVADSELPVVLPLVNEYEPTGTGESPLANIKDWVEVYGHINDQGEFETLEKGDSRGKIFFRETNTMPQWAGSSWYYLRFIDPENNQFFADKTKEAKWSPVDFYVGGAEHATRHLIYARFWHKFFFDQGLLSYDEPFTKLQTVGLILAEDGRKMSKRWGNVVNPDDVIAEYGADAMRLYEMFMGPFDQSVAWSTRGVSGVKRFLDRYVKLSEKITEGFTDTDAVLSTLHKTIKKVGEDIENFKFNTAISSLMILQNELDGEEHISKDLFQKMTLILAPFAVHTAEEMWQNVLGNTVSVHSADWPAYDETRLMSSSATVAIQVNGKLRATLEVPMNISQEDIVEQAKTIQNISKWLEGTEIIKIIYVANKLLNIVVKG